MTLSSPFNLSQQPPLTHTRKQEHQTNFCELIKQAHSMQSKYTTQMAKLPTFLLLYIQVQRNAPRLYLIQNLPQFKNPAAQAIYNPHKDTIYDPTESNLVFLCLTLTNFSHTRLLLTPPTVQVFILHEKIGMSNYFAE